MCGERKEAPNNNSKYPSIEFLIIHLFSEEEKNGQREREAKENVERKNQKALFKSTTKSLKGGRRQEGSPNDSHKNNFIP